MRVLVTGSSHRKESRGWTDPVPIRRFLLAIRDAQPVIIHGASWGQGADHIVDVEADCAGILREPYPVDKVKDGYGKPSPIRRNVRMEAESHPQVGAAFVVGNVGESVGTNGHYLTNGSDHMVNILRSHGKAVVVYRENGPEPCRDLVDARDVLANLWRAGLCRDDVAVAGKAVAAAGQGADADVGAGRDGASVVAGAKVAAPTLGSPLAASLLDGSVAIIEIGGERLVIPHLSPVDAVCVCADIAHDCDGVLRRDRDHELFVVSEYMQLVAHLNHPIPW